MSSLRKLYQIPISRLEEVVQRRREEIDALRAQKNQLEQQKIKVEKQLSQVVQRIRAVSGESLNGKTEAVAMQVAPVQRGKTRQISRRFKKTKNLPRGTNPLPLQKVILEVFKRKGEGSIIGLKDLAQSVLSSGYKTTKPKSMRDMVCVALNKHAKALDIKKVHPGVYQYAPSDTQFSAGRTADFPNL